MKPSLPAEHPDAACIQATLVEILPTKIWIESGVMGERAVMLQHEGCDPFEYALFGYDYRYTSNGGTYAAAESLARALGAEGPIVHRTRKIRCEVPGAAEIRTRWW